MVPVANTLVSPNSGMTSNAQIKFDKPPRLTSKWFADVVAHPGAMRTSVQLIFDYLKNLQVYKEGDPFPNQFMYFVEDLPMQESLSSFIEAEQSSMGQSQAQLTKKVMELFSRLITGNSRDPAEIAMDALLQGQVVQGTVTLL